MEEELSHTNKPTSLLDKFMLPAGNKLKMWDALDLTHTYYPLGFGKNKSVKPQNLILISTG